MLADELERRKGPGAVLRRDQCDHLIAVLRWAERAREFLCSCDCEACAEVNALLAAYPKDDNG